MSQTTYLTLNKLADRYGVCRRTIVRWAAHPGMAFPPPVVVHHRRYWSLSEVEIWETQRRAG